MASLGLKAETATNHLETSSSSVATRVTGYRERSFPGLALRKATGGFLKAQGKFLLSQVGKNTEIEAALRGQRKLRTAQS